MISREMAAAMEFKKILFVTKFEELCFDALTSLLNLRKAGLNHVVFLHVIERDQVARFRGTGIIKEEEVRLREMANIRFIGWAENLFEQGMEVGVYITVGRVVPETIKAAEKEGADLIVIGRPHKNVLEYLYSGSDVTEITRRARIPVLVFKHTSPDPKEIDPPFARPLIAMDWSGASIRAAGYLKNLGSILEHVDIVHVLREKEIKGDSAMEIQQVRKTIRTRLDSICDEFEAEGISARGHIYVGEPEKEIEKAARECRSSMIVLGSSTKPEIMERWLGSVPRFVSEKTGFPTLIIPPGATD